MSEKSKHGGRRDGAGRKTIGPRGAVPFSGSIPAETAEAIDAARGSKTRSVAMREAFALWLQRRGKPAKSQSQKST